MLVHVSQNKMAANRPQYRSAGIYQISAGFFNYVYVVFIFIDHIKLINLK